MFCLVAIHNGVGEEVLLPHLAELSGTKVKRLYVYQSDSFSDCISIFLVALITFTLNKFNSHWFDDEVRGKIKNKKIYTFQTS